MTAFYLDLAKAELACWSGVRLSDELVSWIETGRREYREGLDEWLGTDWLSDNWNAERSLDEWPLRIPPPKARV